MDIVSNGRCVAYRKDCPAGLPRPTRRTTKQSATNPATGSIKYKEPGLVGNACPTWCVFAVLPHKKSLFCPVEPFTEQWRSWNRFAVCESKPIHRGLSLVSKVCAECRGQKPHRRCAAGFRSFNAMAAMLRLAFRSANSREDSTIKRCLGTGGTGGNGFIGD